MEKKIGIFLLSSYLVLAPFTVSAHAVPVSYSPSEQSVLSDAPSEIIIRFTEHIAQEASSILIYNSKGEVVSTRKATVTKDDTRNFTLSFELTEEDQYTVAWSVLSLDDGHFTKGAYGFSVGAVAPNGMATPLVNYSISLAEFIGTTLEIVGQALLVGMLLIWFFLKFLKGDFSDKERVEKMLRKITIGASLLVIVGVSLYLFNRVGILADGGTSYFLAFKTFLLTSPGKVTFLRLILAVIILLTTFGRKTKYLQLVLILGLLMCRAMVSHAAASHFHPAISVCINFVHLLFKDMWTGGVLLMIPLLYLTGWSNRMFNLLFAKITTIALLVGGMTGTFIVWLHLKGFGEMFTSDWGKLFVVLSFFALLLAVSRMLLMREYEEGLKDQRRIKDLFMVEAAASLGVLILTSVLIITTPPIHQLKSYSHSVSNIHLSDIGSGQMAITPQNVQGIKKVTAVLRNDDKDIGPIIVSLERKEESYVFPKTVFSPVGLWTVEITAEQAERYDAHAVFNIEYPEDLEIKRGDEQKRSFGSFEAVMIVGGLCIITLFLVWWRKLKRLTSF